MIPTIIRKILSGIYGALVLEDLFPHRIRRLVFHMFGSASLILILVLLFGGEAFDKGIRGGLFLCLSITLFLFTLEAYYYSIMVRARDGEFFVCFDIGEVLFYADDEDLTRALLFSDLGDEGMKRLGYTEDQIKDFLTTREHKMFGGVLSGVTNHIHHEEYFSMIYQNDKALQDFLFQNGLGEKEFVGSMVWVVNRERRTIEKERFWSRESLSRIPGIGKNWSYGETYTLDRYGEDLTESTVGYDSGYVKSKETAVARLESVLTRGRGSNAVIVSDDDNSRRDVVTMLSHKINDGTSLISLQHKRVFLINPNAIVESANDKIGFEREFSVMLGEAIHAQNVILVIPNFASFAKSASVMGADVLSILVPFISSPAIHVILLDSKKDYHEFLSNKVSVTENFEMIQTDTGDDSAIISMLIEEVEKIEKESKALITYPAILAIVTSANRYFDPELKVQKSREMMVESVQGAFNNGRKLVLKSDVLVTVELKTGIPMSTPQGEEKEMLKHLEEILHERIIGQEEAVKVISEALKRNRAGVRNPDKPIGTFLFLGPTGVGKTETTKALAEVVFGNAEVISRFDMSEFRDDMALERLIGSFGTGKSGALSMALREKPYGVLLLDEFEKTTTDIINLFLRVFDEGIFTDAEGRKINAKNNVIIATSNAGSELIWDIVKNGNKLVDEKDRVMNAIIEQGIFKPELLNRFDAVVLFHPLSPEHLHKIAALMINKFKKRMRDKGIMIEATDGFISYLVGKGNDPKFGARPMNRAISEEVEKFVADKIISGDIKEGGKIVFDVDTAGALLIK
jgi:ATP-dependent Clp protease ATP-binding subunit ClpC